MAVSKNVPRLQLAAYIFPFGFRYRGLLPVYELKLYDTGYPVSKERVLRDAQAYLAYDPMAMDVRLGEIKLLIQTDQPEKAQQAVAWLNKYKGVAFDLHKASGS